MNSKLSKVAAIGSFAAVMAVGIGSAQAAPLPGGWTSVGNAGQFTAQDGVVTLAPGFNAYQWISTYNSPSGAGVLPVGATGLETNGAFMRTPTFAAASGDALDFYFNYITSDGDGYPEYAWAGLFDGTGAFLQYLFTARTTPTGDTVPGFGLPGLGAGVTLTPSSTPIIPGGPAFSPLGNYSGACWDDGCGYTGWIEMDYAFTSAGNYYLGFGVTNANDFIYHSAFAVAGVSINDKPIDPVPEPGSLALLGLGLLGMAGLRRRRNAG